MQKSDGTLEYLLDLDGYIAEIDYGYWIKIEAKMVKKPDSKKPYGVKYSLTLHAPDGKRVLGYDNAHSAPKAAKSEPHDHVHKGTRTKKYAYQNAAVLLEDFWHDVEVIVNGRT